MSVLNNTTVNGVVTQTQAAAADNQLIRLGEAKTLLTALFQGAWGSGATYTRGQMVSEGGSLYISNQTTTGQQPSLNPSVWLLAAAGGANGTSAFNYIAYASDTSGTGFSRTPGVGLNYIAFLTSGTPISSPTADNFSGLWQRYVGAPGDPGGPGDKGDAGDSAYLYVGYASDASGTGFSATPGSGLNYIAFLSTNTFIPSPAAGNFTGLWKNYTNPFTVTAPLTFTGGTLALNASSANTASYVVQRDASGNFSAGAVTVTSLVVGSATLAFTSANLTVNTAVTIGGALTLNGLSGVLVTTAGVVAGNADTNALPEGTVNVATPAGNAYFTRARVLETPLTGISNSNVVLATDTVLTGIGKLDAKMVLTGYVSGAGTVAATDTILGAIQKLNGNQAATAAALNLVNPTFTGTVTLNQAAQNSGSPNVLVLNGGAHTTLAGGVEASDAVFNFARTVQFNTGALTLQRAAYLAAPTYAFVGASTLTTAVTWQITGAPVAGTNATVTNAVALKISGGAVGSGTVNGYGLYVDAPTGATNNYAACFNTGDVLVNAGWVKAATSFGLKVNALQVVSDRRTGWTAATGTATRTSFATSSVTLPNLAQAVKAIIDDLIAHGLIGA